jgi:hypothetical protein
MSRVELKATELKYEFFDENGYSFTVTAQFDPEWGWSAQVVLSTNTAKTSEAAIDRLEAPAREFLKQLAARQEGASNAD